MDEGVTETTFALRDGGAVTLDSEGLAVTGRAPRREPYAAIRNAWPGEYGLGTAFYYVACLTQTFPLDLMFPDRESRDRFLAALLARLG